MGENIVKTKSFEFALKIMRVYRVLLDEKKEFVLSKQLVRSGTSIGANVRESEQAESKKDFIHKMSIALKEANECEYWIELFQASGLLEGEVCIDLQKDIKQLLRLITSIIKTAKSNL